HATTPMRLPPLDFGPLLNFIGVKLSETQISDQTFRGGLSPATADSTGPAGSSPPLNGRSGQWLIEPLAAGSVCPVELQQAMKLGKQNLLGGFNRYRLVITLGLAVLLPAAALIYVNFSQLRSFQRDKVLEATIKQDFQEFLAISEKKMSKKTYAKIEEVRDLF